MQKTGMKWFADGNRNTKIFHAYVTGRRKRLQLNRIQNSEGEWLEEQSDIASEAVRFFQQQFTEDFPENFDVLEHNPEMISSDQNESLIQIPDELEIKRAAFALNGESSSGPDEFTGAFYQTSWAIIKKDIIVVVQTVFRGQDLPRFVTHTNLVLIPKKDQINSFSDVTPISLSNFINKVIYMVLHDRMVTLLPTLISPNQTVFV